MVDKVYISSAYSKGIGATRTIHYIDGTKETEEVVQVGHGSITFKPKSSNGKPGSYYTLTYFVRRLLPSWTEIILEAKYHVKAGLWGTLRKTFPIASTERQLQHHFRQVLEGIEYHLMTRKIVPKMNVSGRTSEKSESTQMMTL